MLYLFVFYVDVLWVVVGIVDVMCWLRDWVLVLLFVVEVFLVLVGVVFDGVVDGV